MIRFISAYLILFVSASLSSKTTINDQNISEADSDTLTISESVAVLFHPDSQRIKKLKKERGEDFYVIADDANWYVANAREFLEKQGLKTIDTDKGYISFIRESEKTITLDTDSLEPIWGLIFFDGKKEPLVTYPVDAQYDYDLYFKK